MRKLLKHGLSAWFYAASQPSDLFLYSLYSAHMSDAEDPSDSARKAILEALLKHVPFDGWTKKSLISAVRDIDLPKGSEELYFPGGALEAINFWSDLSDTQVVEHLTSLDLGNMRIRDKVTTGVLKRLEAIGSHEQAARRALSRLSFPDAIGQGPSQLWASADAIWRAIGDTSTDGNYYSKRLILSGVIGSSMLSWLSDDSLDKGKAKEFLDARIENVMRFEKAKWDFKKRTENFPDPAEILGGLRYGNKFRRRRSR